MKERSKAFLRTKSVILILLVLIAVLVASPDSPFDGYFASLVRNSMGYISTNGNFSVTLPRIIATVLAIAVCMLLSTMGTLLLGKLETQSRRMLTVASVLKSLLKWAMAILGGIWVLSILGIDMSAALAGVGIMALVLSFGAQSLVEDVVTGIFIMFEGSFNVGDIVVLDDFRGIVRNIGVRTTVIEDMGGNLKIVNNSDIRNIQNRSEKASVAVCDLAISYQSSLCQAEEALEKAMDELYDTYRELFLLKPQYLGVQQLADSAVILRICAKVEEKDIFDAQRLMNRRFKLAMDEAGIEIPFPQIVVHETKNE